MSNRLLVLLLGGRVQPALMTTIHLLPDRVACIASADEKKVAARVAAWLEENLPDIEVANAMQVDPYKTDETRRAVQQIAEEATDYEIEVSVTGAPVPMVIGGCDAARALGGPAWYHNTARGELIDVAQGDTLLPSRLRLSVSEFVRANAIRIKPQPLLDEATLARQRAASVALSKDLDVTTRLLRWMARETIRKSRGREGRWNLDEQHEALFEALAATGVLRGVKRDLEQGTVFYIVGNQADARFVGNGGGWLEHYVLETARSQTLEGEALFDDCMKEVHIESEGGAEKEIDFIGVRRGVGLIASCKTSLTESWEKSVLSELASVAKPLGDNYCIKLYVTNQPMPLPGDAKYEAVQMFLDWAKEQRVVVVMGDELPNLGRILVEQVTNPKYVRR